MLVLHWDLVNYITVSLYFLILLFLPLNPLMSTVFLLMIIAFWSRLPGVGAYSPMFILYHADIVDLLSLIVAVNVGGFIGGMFSVFGNIASRACGVTPAWNLVIKDAISQFMICLLVPFIHPLFGSDIFVTMMAYSILRRVFFMVLYLIQPDIPLISHIFRWTGATIVQVGINMVQMSFLGFFFDALLKSSVRFNWLIFFVVTLIVILSNKMLSRKGVLTLKNIFSSLISKQYNKGRNHQKKHNNSNLEELRKIKELI